MPRGERVKESARRGLRRALGRSDRVRSGSVHLQLSQSAHLSQAQALQSAHSAHLQASAAKAVEDRLPKRTIMVAKRVFMSSFSRSFVAGFRARKALRRRDWNSAWRRRRRALATRDGGDGQLDAIDRIQPQNRSIDRLRERSERLRHGGVTAAVAAVIRRTAGLGFAAVRATGRRRRGERRHCRGRRQRQRQAKQQSPQPTHHAKEDVAANRCHPNFRGLFLTRSARPAGGRSGSRAPSASSGAAGETRGAGDRTAATPPASRAAGRWSTIPPRGPAKTRPRR